MIVEGGEIDEGFLTKAAGTAIESTLFTQQWRYWAAILRLRLVVSTDRSAHHVNVRNLLERVCLYLLYRTVRISLLLKPVLDSLLPAFRELGRWLPRDDVHELHDTAKLWMARYAVVAFDEVLDDEFPVAVREIAATSCDTRLGNPVVPQHG